MIAMPSQTQKIADQERRKFEQALFTHAIELLTLHRKVLGGYDVDYVTESHSILERGAALAQIAGGLVQLGRVQLENRNGSGSNG